MPTFLMNPWVLLGALLAALSLFGGGVGLGMKIQSGSDQSAINEVNTKITEQKKEANAALQGAMQANLDRQKVIAEQDNKQEQERLQNEKVIYDLHNTISSNRLRFQASNTGCGSNSGSPVSSTKDQAGSPSASGTCELSETAGRALTEIVTDCSELAKDYKRMYDAWE